MITVIVPVYNGGTELPRCIDALLHAGVPSERLVIVDDCSTDGVARQVASDHGTRYELMANGPMGPALARNHGAMVSTDASLLLFVDADVIVQPDTVDRFVAVFDENPQVQAVFGSYDNHPDSPGVISQYKNLLHHYMHQTGSRQATTFWSGCGAVRREAFLSMGGFDPRYRKASIEDIDLGLRMTDAGYAVELRPEILCKHLKHWSLKGWLKTDIFSRAVPWTQLLIQRDNGVPNNLNLGYRERLTAACALLFPLGLLMLLLQSLGAGAMMGQSGLVVCTLSLVGFVALQWPILTFFNRRHGFSFAVTTLALHWVYFVYSSVTFVVVHIGSWLAPSAFLRSA